MREYLRVSLRESNDGLSEVLRSTKDGSAMLASLAQSDGLVELGEDVTEITPGTPLLYRSFSDLLSA